MQEREIIPELVVNTNSHNALNSQSGQSQLIGQLASRLNELTFYFLHKIVPSKLVNKFLKLCFCTVINKAAKNTPQTASAIFLT